MRQLSHLEVNSHAVAGAGTITYAPAIVGYEVVGWEKTFLYWNTTQTIEYGIFVDTVYVTDVPVYDITPVYAPITYYYV